MYQLHSRAYVREHLRGFVVDVVIACYDDVGVVARGIHVKLRHGLDGFLELAQHGFFGAAAFADVSVLAAFEAEFLTQIHVNLRPFQFEQFGPVEREQAFDDQVLTGLDAELVRLARVRGEVVHGPIDGST